MSRSAGRQLPAARFALAVIGAVVVWEAGILALVTFSPRLLPSWHGFLHVGIASMFPSPTLVPENPFFAGEPLSYYWFYQWVGARVSHAVAIDPLHAFQAITLLSLALLVVAAALAGRHLYRSTAAGLLIGYLALVGMNPLGPVIAAGKYAILGQSLLQASPDDPGGDVFVTDAQADDRMAAPLLGALHLGTDWRGSQNIVWFFDISSRGPALALLMAVAWLVTRPRPGPGPLVTLVPLSALTTAFNPLIGLSAAGALAAASVLLWAFERRTPRGLGNSVMVARSGAVLCGALAAWPSYAHLLAFSQPLEGPDAAWIVVRIASIVTGFMVLVPLALWGMRYGPEEARPGLATVTCAGLLLIAVVPVLGLPEGNQHNFLNAASGLLAVPAAAWVCGRTGASLVPVRRRAAIAALIFLPTTRPAR